VMCLPYSPSLLSIWHLIDARFLFFGFKQNGQMRDGTLLPGCWSSICATCFCLVDDSIGGPFPSQASEALCCAFVAKVLVSGVTTYNATGAHYLW
jgi:hypothetical protein